MSAAARTAAYSGLALALKEALAGWQQGVPMAADERGRVYTLVPHAVSMVGHFRTDVVAHPGGEEAPSAVAQAARAVAQAGGRAASVLRRVQCRFPEAVALCKRVLAIDRALHGGDQAVHAQVADSLNHLANACMSAGDLSAARQHCEGSLAMNSKLHGGGGMAHQSTATSLHIVAMLCRLTGDLTAARGRFEAALAMRRKLFGTVHENDASSLRGLATVCLDEGGLVDSLNMFQQVFGGATPVRAEIASSLQNLGEVSYKEGKLDQALEWFEKCLGRNAWCTGEGA